MPEKTVVVEADGGRNQAEGHRKRNAPELHATRGPAVQTKKAKKSKKRRRSSTSTSSSASEEDGMAALMRWQQQQQQSLAAWASWQQQASMAYAMPTWPHAAGQPGWHGGGPLYWQNTASGAGTSSSSGTDMRSRPHDVDSRDTAEGTPVFLRHAVQEVVAVPRGSIGKIIGPKGSTIAGIRKTSGAWKVDASDQSSDPIEVKLEGTSASVKKAKEMILDLLAGVKARNEGAEFVDISQGRIGKVIGPKGATVNLIETRTGTKIDIDYEREPCRVYVQGPPAGVQQAKQAIVSFAEAG
eukprot:TRINITY_DN10461_c0_g2_i1.p1 TRINITY_DN10461_c0_g2~~TRINITY_DN10461_c0_g2_i1.p1  ORF type:complete len:298 (+),score=63.47 TRINITY_DN10461_c0_g2_i1:72-965(+)